MIIAEIGEVAPGFHVLGSAHTPSYLVDAERPVLIDGGMAHLGNRYVEHARRVLGERSPELLLQTHMHFDHCGASAHLKAAFPGVRSGASSQGAEIIGRPRALEVIAYLNGDARGLDEEHEVPDAPYFMPFDVDLILKDGDTLDLGGGLTLKVFATPGHTRDFLSYYIPEKGILIASEAVGCAHRSGKVMVEFVSDYEAYLTSLRFLSTLEARVLCQGHVFVYTGEDVSRFLAESLAATLRYRERVEELLALENGAIEAVVERMKAEEWEPLSWPKQPEAAFLLNTEGRVRNLASLAAAR